MTSQEGQRAKRAFVRDLVTAVISYGTPPGESNPLLRWTSRAISEKLSRGISSVYPTGEEHTPNFILGDGDLFDLYLPKMRTVVKWRPGSKTWISSYRIPGESPPDGIDVLDSCQSIGDEKTKPNTAFFVHIPRDSNDASDVFVASCTSEKLTEEQERRRIFVRDLMTTVIMRPSQRDRQRLPGPSDLADPCDLCVARKIAASMGISLHHEANGSFSLKAWMGTAIHEKLERDLPVVYPRGDHKSPNFRQEITAKISHVPDLGDIKGHVDLHLPKKGIVTDWKTADTRRIELYRSRGVPASHAGQTMLYLHGLRQEGRNAHTAVLVYIPRDSGQMSGVWVASCAYREDIARGLLNRARKLVEVIRSGDTGNLASDPDCYVCHVQHRIRH